MRTRRCRAAGANACGDFGRGGAKESAAVQQRVAQSVRTITLRNVPPPSKKSIAVVSNALTIEAPYGIDGAYYASMDIERSVEHSL